MRNITRNWKEIVSLIIVLAFIIAVAAPTPSIIEDACVHIIVFIFFGLILTWIFINVRNWILYRKWKKAEKKGKK